MQSSLRRPPSGISNGDTRGVIFSPYNFYSHARRALCRSCIAAAVLASGGLPLTATIAQTAQPPWAEQLLQELPKVEAQGRAKIGVYVRDLDTGANASYRGEQSWYIASMVKVPIAIAVLRGVERDQFTLDTTVTLRAADYVDGAGTTNQQPIGTHLSVRSLLEQMIIYSDNAASDMLIDLVGISEVNAAVESLVPEGFRRITSLAEIRRMIYGYLVPNPDRLTGQDLMRLNRERADADRLRLLSQLTDTPASRFRTPTLEAAYRSYYATGLNSARLDAYAQLLTLLVEGRALTPPMTDHLLRLMERVETGTRRLKAGLPSTMRFAHKTGTQRGRICDSGIARLPEAGRERRVVIVACTRDEAALPRSEFALMQVAAAICRSGVLTQGTPNAPSCPPGPHAQHVLPAASQR